MSLPWYRPRRGVSGVGTNIGPARKRSGNKWRRRAVLEPLEERCLLAAGTGTVNAQSTGAAPVVTAAPSLTGTEGMTTGSLLVATFTDSAGALPASDYAAAIDWGDGSTSNGAITFDASTGIFSVYGTHTYTEEGTYLPVVTVEDEIGGATGETTDTAFIVDAALTPAPLTITSTEGLAFSGVAGDFTDANPYATVADYTATINWGDGAITSGVVKKVSPSTFGVSGSHLYTLYGTYNVTVSVQDYGGSTATIDSTAVVADAPLTPTTASISSVEGQPIAADTTVATFLDSYAEAPLTGFSATINWGNGTTTVGTVKALGSGNFAVEGGTIYDERGSYTITVAIHDKGGASTTATSFATISDAPLTSTAVEFQGVAGQTTVPTTVATFTDANTFSESSDFAATINWGDGTTTPGTVVSLSGGDYAVVGSHLFEQAQSYAVAVSMSDVTDVVNGVVERDGNGASTTAESTAVIAAAPLTPGTPYTLTPSVGQAFSGAVAQFTDPNPYATPSDYVATINWGDGTTTEGVIAPTSVSSGTGAVTFSVSSASPHSYDEVTPLGQPGFTVQVQVVDLGGSTLDTTAVADVADAPITATGVSPIQSVEGDTVNAEVAQFVDGNSFAVPSDFTATIDWGNGLATPGTIALNTTNPLSPNFTVNGTNTYAEEGQYAINVTISDNAGTTAPVVTTVANIADAPLTPGTVQSISPIAGQAFSGELATFNDTYKLAPLSDFTATINWGDGTPMIADNATISQPGGVGTPLVVSGTHTYASAAPSIPISITVNDAGGSTLAIGTSANVQIALSGAGTGSAASGVTRDNQPQFSGQAEPGATVELLANGVDVGKTTAGTSGSWTITSKALADGTYAFTANVLATDTSQLVQSVALTHALVIDTTGPTVAGVVFDPAADTLQVILQDTGSGVNLASAANPADYQLQLPSGRTATTFRTTGLTVTPGPAGSGEAIVNINYALGKRPKTGAYVVTIMADNITDLAGNTLVEKTFVTFPQTTNSPNPNYVAQITVGRGLTASAPQIYISAAERLAAERYAARVHAAEVRRR